MKYTKLCCPSCGAGISIDVKGQKVLYCPYCGSQFLIDDADVTVKKNITIKKTYINEAALEKEKRRERENHREYKEFIYFTTACFLLVLIGLGSLVLMDLNGKRNKQKAIDAGMIQVGQSASELEGQKYQGVMQILESAGFTNIDIVDLDDAGWFTNKADTVAKITIGGNSSFEASTYFDPDTKIIISYH